MTCSHDKRPCFRPVVPSGLVLSPREPLRRPHLEEMLAQRVPGVCLPNVLTREQARLAVDAIKRLPTEAYDGNAADLGAAIGVSHWDARYPGANTPEAWHRYFDAVAAWDELRERVFRTALGFDPLEMLVGVLQEAYCGPVRRARHPRFGRLMGAGLVRFGRARPHIDNAVFDLGLDADGHLGAVLVLDASSTAVQRVYSLSLERSLEHSGNYDLPVPDGVPFVDLPSPVGSLGLLAAPLVHEVIDHDQRLTVAMHVRSQGRRRVGLLRVSWSTTRSPDACREQQNKGADYVHQKRARHGCDAWS